MIIETKFDMEQKVKCRISEFAGKITGIVIRPGFIECEVQPVTDEGANHRPAVWINESYLELVHEK